MCHDNSLGMCDVAPSIMLATYSTLGLDHGAGAWAVPLLTANQCCCKCDCERTTGVSALPQCAECGRPYWVDCISDDNLNICHACMQLSCQVGRSPDPSRVNPDSTLTPIMVMPTPVGYALEGVTQAQVALPRSLFARMSTGRPLQPLTQCGCRCG